MKGYILIFLLAALLLLLLPLPALPWQPVLAPPDTDISTPTQDTDPQPDAPDTPAQTEAAFRVLCGDEVVTLTERDFLIRTLAMEMSPSYHTEALKAQAVASYTYYGRRREAQKSQPDAALQGADFATPDPSFPAAYTPEMLQQRWGEQYDLNYEKICTAVDAVLGRAMVWEGAYIDACYFSISNGCTESAATVWGADIPYLQAVASPGDRLAPQYATTVTLTADEVRAALTAGEPTLALPEEPADWFGTPEYSQAGTVASIPVGDLSLSGARVRELLQLRSATFTVTYAQGQFTFSVQGYGHGVGMSQYGADHLARQGYTWEEILRYYYTGITIV